MEWVTNPVARDILSALFRARQEGTFANLASFSAEHPDPGARVLITELATEDRPIPDPARQLTDLAHRLRNAELDRRIAAQVRLASLPETSEPARLDALRAQQMLRAQKRAPFP
jgi:hypothetical protein